MMSRAAAMQMQESATLKEGKWLLPLSGRDLVVERQDEVEEVDDVAAAGQHAVDEVAEDAGDQQGDGDFRQERVGKALLAPQEGDQA